MLIPQQSDVLESTVVVSHSRVCTLVLEEGTCRAAMDVLAAPSTVHVPAPTPACPTLHRKAPR
jgi:hypothetical protein